LDCIGEGIALNGKNPTSAHAKAEPSPSQIPHIRNHSFKWKNLLLIRIFYCNQHAITWRGFFKQLDEITPKFQELPELEKGEFLLSKKDGNRIYYKANSDFPLFHEIQQILIKTVGLQIVPKSS
jgi:hypothetical protein